MRRVVVFINFFLTCFSNLISVDLTRCKLTHRGTEYIGKISITDTNLTCQYWKLTQHKGSESIIDEIFPDGSKISAKNYCRNPNNNPRGPWCYTIHKKFLVDTCDVPLCRISECRISGTGMEYAGLTEKSASGRKCEKWKKNHHDSFFKDNFFPDGSVDKAGNKCRNPDSSISGPWCYVKSNENNFLVKELCDIPFCDDIGYLMYSEGDISEEYFFFSSINERQGFNISVRLWNPEDWFRGEVFLFLSSYDVATGRKDIERWSSGVEIKLSYNGSGILFKKEDTLKKTPLILSGANWADLKITWTNKNNQSLIVRLYHNSKPKPVGISQIIIPNTIFEIESFRYISLGGSPAFWNIPSYDKVCSVHTVTRTNLTRFWLIKKTTLKKNIEIFIRAHKVAVITLRMAPMIQTYQIQVVFEDKDNIKVFSYNNKNQPYLIKEKSWLNVLSFWKWQYFKIKLFKDRLQLYWVQKMHIDLILEATHQNIEKIMWITFGSPRVSYWTVYCDPRGVSDPLPASPPECVTQRAEVFNGTQSVTSSGRQCIPWTDKVSLPEKYRNDDLFKTYGGRVNCQNFCRNLDFDPEGAYCIVRKTSNESGFVLDHCHPRFCSFSDCKLIGTGNDYVGEFNTMRSKRKCRIWTEVDDVLKLSNFPNSTMKDALNFFKNHNNSVTRSWSFTEDRKEPRDLCFIKECDKPLECTALTAGYREGTYFYILPPWRKNGLNFWLKAWNPDIYEGLIISLISRDYLKQYRLLVGAAENEETILLYKEGHLELQLVHKTLPHLIPTGRWRGFWLRSSYGKIELGYEGVPNAFFEWTASKKRLSFEPMFLNFGTIKNHWVAVNFQCSECITTQTSDQTGYKIYPINIWRDEALTSNLSLNLRGTGSAFVTLMWTQDFQKRFAIRIMSDVPSIYILHYTKNDTQILDSFSVSSAMSANKWSEYVLSFTEENLIVHKDNKLMFDWTSPFRLHFYWFGVTAEKGTVTWSANCPASDIDGRPRDGNWGKWGPWSCSVTCGKGVGRMIRECNDPPPNVYGKECKGSALYEGPCNDFPCGKISPDTISRIRQYLSSQHKSLQVDVAERVVLTCNSEAISLITAEVSEINITWTHNGFPYSRTKFHMNENYSLVIPRAQEKHNGIYLCMAYQDPDSIPSKVVLEVISLVVIKSKPTKKIRKGKSLTLKCNGLPLSYVYADLSVRWELNGTVWKDYGLGTLQTFTVDKLENITDSHAGVWTCVVIQEDFKFKWTTNWIYLKVKSAPNFWSYLMEDVATAPLFGKLGNEKNAKILFFALTSTVIGVTVLVTVLLMKWFTK